MQAYIKDLSTKQRTADDKSFQICQRVLHKCHEIIFEDIPNLVVGPYSSSMRIHARTKSSRKRVKPHMQPTIVGIGCILASVPGMPRLTDVYGRDAIEQGRVEDGSMGLSSLATQRDADAPIGMGPANTEDSAEDIDDDEEADSEPENVQKPSMSSLFFTIVPPEVGSDSVQPSIPGRRMTVGASKTSPSLALSERSPPSRRTNSIGNPFSGENTNSAAMTPYQSSPTVLPSKRASSLGNDVFSDTVLTQYDAGTQKALLQSHYCQSEASIRRHFQQQRPTNYRVLG